MEPSGREGRSIRGVSRVGRSREGGTFRKSLEGVSRRRKAPGSSGRRSNVRRPGSVDGRVTPRSGKEGGRKNGAVVLGRSICRFGWRSKGLWDGRRKSGDVEPGTAMMFVSSRSSRSRVSISRRSGFTGRPSGFTSGRLGLSGIPGATPPGLGASITSGRPGEGRSFRTSGLTPSRGPTVMILGLLRLRVSGCRRSNGPKFPIGRSKARRLASRSGLARSGGRFGCRFSTSPGSGVKSGVGDLPPRNVSFGTIVRPRRETSFLFCSGMPRWSVSSSNGRGAQPTKPLPKKKFAVEGDHLEKPPGTQHHLL